FCHWVVVTGSKDHERYLDALDREMALHKRRQGVDRIPVRSLLIGGGTPSWLAPRHLDRLLAMVARHFDVSGQYSLEPEPSTMLGAEGDERMRILRAH